MPICADNADTSKVEWRIKRMYENRMNAFTFKVVSRYLDFQVEEKEEDEDIG